MRDATRGGLAAVLHEWSAASSHSIAIEASSIPTDPRVIAACELLGIDPIHVACEGTMVIAIPANQSAMALEVLRKIPIAASSAIIGTVVEKTAAPVMIRRGLGRYQAIDQPTGAPLPRIC
jgi:hydrogenase expression/formation protein HypE